MALIIEDGTGRADAESYISVAGADLYHGNRGNSMWQALATERKEQLLRQATDYMAIYDSQWVGQRAVLGQALGWPRVGAVVYGQDVASNVVPLPVANACAALALKALSGPLAPDGGQAVKRQKVGPLEKEYQDNTSAKKTFTGVNQMLGGYLGAGGPYMAKLERS